MAAMADTDTAGQWHALSGYFVADTSQPLAGAIETLAAGVPAGAVGLVRDRLGVAVRLLDRVQNDVRSVVARTVDGGGVGHNSQLERKLAASLRYRRPQQSKLASATGRPCAVSAIADSLGMRHWPVDGAALQHTDE